MAIWQYDIIAVPRESIITAYDGLPSDIPPKLFDSHNWWQGRHGPDESELSALLPIARSWSESIKAWGENEDENRIELLFDKEGLYEIKIRIDLRKPLTIFLKAIIDLAVRHKWVFWTDEARLIDANVEAIVSDIKQSEAFSFVSNPAVFLERFSKQS